MLQHKRQNFHLLNVICVASLILVSPLYQIKLQFTIFSELHFVNFVLHMCYLLTVPSVEKEIHAPSAVFWQLATLALIDIRPVRLIPLPCQLSKDGA